MLEIKNLKAGVEGREILKGINLTINAGEVHAIMGPNGSGKSTLAQVLAGREAFEVAEGSVTYKGQDLLELAPEVRVREGLFLAFQYPVEIPGVNTTYFLRAAVNAVREHHGEAALNAVDFLKLMREKIELLQLDEALLKRSVNEGFSGGEKKRNEILQMTMLVPRLAILDETDSGLDIDALQDVVDGTIAHRQSQVPAVERIVTEEMVAFEAWLRVRQAAPIISRMRRRVEDIWRGELAKAVSRLGDLDGRERLVMERMVHSIVQKVLHEPTVGLREHVVNDEGPQYPWYLRELHDARLPSGSDKP